MDALNFHQVTDAHRFVIERWLNSSHLQDFYKATFEKIQLRSRKNQCFIVTFNDKPFGYIQSYPVDHTHDLSHFRLGHTLGIDLFIGDVQFLRQGFGLKMLTQYIAGLDQSVDRILVDPISKNQAAINLFSKYGFYFLDEFGNHSILCINTRQAVRGIVINPKREVLLIRFKGDPSKANQKHISDFWLTPGGKIEANENEHDALLREIQEEVGMTDVNILRKVYADSWVDVWDNIPMHLFNRYYLVETEQSTFSADYLMEDEKSIYLGAKWWTVAELLTTDAVFFPHCLPKILMKELE